MALLESDVTQTTKLARGRGGLLRTTGLVLAFAAMLGNTASVMAATPVAAQPNLTTAQKIALLRAKVKYVFVIFHENESFDHYFGTFPGANGLYSAPAGATPANLTPSFRQTYLDTSLNTVVISPFLMPQAVTTASGAIVPIYPADEISVDHSHQGMSNGLHVNPATGIAANDRYAMDQESLTTNSLRRDRDRKRRGADIDFARGRSRKPRTDIGHIDCDTIPFMWRMGEEFHPIRQLPPDNRGAVHSERDCGDCGTVRRNTVGAA